MTPERTFLLFVFQFCWRRPVGLYRTGSADSSDSSSEFIFSLSFVSFFNEWTKSCDMFGGHVTSSVGLICFVRSTLFISATVKHFCGRSFFVVLPQILPLTFIKVALGLWRRWFLSVFFWSLAFSLMIYIQYIDMWLMCVQIRLVTEVCGDHSQWHHRFFTWTDSLTSVKRVTADCRWEDERRWESCCLLWKHSWAPPRNSEDGGGLTGCSQERSGRPSSRTVTCWQLKLLIAASVSVDKTCVNPVKDLEFCMIWS